MKLKFTRATRQDFRKLRKLYYAAFPPEERAPFLLLWRRASRENVDFWSISLNGAFCGLLYIVHDGALSYVFYFAVAEERQGEGIGSLCLRALQKLYRENRIFLAIEELDKHAANYAERVRRKQFYQRNGFQELHSRVMEGSVIFELLGVGGTVTAEEYQNLMQQYIGKYLFRNVPIRMID